MASIGGEREATVVAGGEADVVLNRGYVQLHVVAWRRREAAGPREARLGSIE
jgi:hypothetical protein